MAARKSPAEARMLEVVAAASAGTMSVCRTPNWANGASSAMASRPSAVARANLRFEWSAVRPLRARHRSVRHLVPHELRAAIGLDGPSARVSWRP